MNKRKREGFHNEKIIVIPPSLKTELSTDSVCKNLYLTDIGLFPKASNHFVERPKGCLEYVIQFCFDGEGYSIFDNKKEKISANQYFILPPQKKHIYGSPPNSTWKVGWIHFLGIKAETIVEKLNKKGFGKAHNFSYSSNWIKEFNDIIDVLKYDLSYPGAAFNSCRLWSLFGSMVYQNRQNVSHNSPVDKAIKLMQENITEYLNLNEIAGAASLSVSRFSVIFKEQTGVSPKEYHTGLKIQKACSYLSMTDMPIKDIALALAFEDPYYFSRCFKKFMDVSPAHYRKNNIL